MPLPAALLLTEPGSTLSLLIFSPSLADRGTACSAIRVSNLRRLRYRWCKTHRPNGLWKARVLGTPLDQDEVPSVTLRRGRAFVAAVIFFSRLAPQRSHSRLSAIPCARRSHRRSRAGTTRSRSLLTRTLALAVHLGSTVRRPRSHTVPGRAFQRLPANRVPWRSKKGGCPTNGKDDPGLPRGYRLDEVRPRFVFLNGSGGPRAAVSGGLVAAGGPLEEATEWDLLDRPPGGEKVEGG